MPQQLRVDDIVAQRTVDTEVTRNVSISSRLSPAERVVSVNARVEITDAEAERGYVVYSGLIRATIFYAEKDNPANVISIRQTFQFTDRVAVNGARPGLDVNIDALISDINFNLINERLIEVEFVVTSDIELTAPEVVEFVEERPGVQIERQRYRIQRELRERNYTRTIEDVERIPSNEPDIKRVVDIEADLQLINITTDYNRVAVRGVINNNLLYVSNQNKLEYVNLRTPFNESFDFSGVTPEMTPFVDVTIAEVNVDRVDNRRIRKTFELNFRILVVQEEVVEIPTRIITERYYPVRRTVLVERIVAEQRTRILESDQITISEGNPDIDRVVRATARIIGGSVDAEATDGGVIISGTDDVNIIYVAALPDQPVYFTSGRVNFSSFIDIAGVEEGMNVVADVKVERVTANKVNNRTISVRIVHEVNLIVTEQVRIPIVTGISEQPTQAPEAPTTGEYITYTVQSGDTLYLIAQRYGTTVERLAAINNITNPSQLQVGQQLRIPR